MDEMNKRKGERVDEKTIAEWGENPAGVKFRDLSKFCDRHFGQPRQRATSHRVYRTPWLGDPRVNIQASAGGMAKPYQVRQVIKAVAKLKAEEIT